MIRFFRFARPPPPRDDDDVDTTHCPCPLSPVSSTRRGRRVYQAALATATAYCYCLLLLPVSCLLSPAHRLYRTYPPAAPA